MFVNALGAPRAHSIKPLDPVNGVRDEGLRFLPIDGEIQSVFNDTTTLLVVSGARIPGSG